MDVHRIEVSFQKDAGLSQRTSRLQSLGFSVKNVRLVEVYTFTKDYTKSELEAIASQLANPVFQEYKIDSATAADFDFAIEVGFLPGVTDNVANTVRQMAEDYFKARLSEGEEVFSSQLFLFDGMLSRDEINKICRELSNPTIQRTSVKTKEEYGTKGMDIIVPRVNLHELPVAQDVNLEVSDDELTKIGKEGVLDKNTLERRGPLALDLVSMQAIRDYFVKKGRKPTDLELESLAQTWSEHCKHTIFANPMDDDVPDGLYKTFIKAATNEIRKARKEDDLCVSVFTDNSGAIAFDENYAITHKVETHNSPTALDPYGGSITGIVGVNRDTIGFGLGAKPAINFYGYCFADPTTRPKLYRGKDKLNPIIPPRQVMEGVVRGVKDGGNCSGIPTPQGFCYFNEKYAGKPLVFAGTVGLIPLQENNRNLIEKKALPGDAIVMVGGRVGKDGVHGATFSSEALSSGSPATAVQIGDPITQKKMSDAIVKEARSLGLYNSITDNGAGGISCSVAEMARESNGCLVWLDKVPLKYAGMAPWEIWISESQERMTLSVPQAKVAEFISLMNRRGIEATVIGEFTSSGKCIVKYKQNTLMDVELDFLHNGLPKKQLKSTLTQVTHAEPTIPCPIDLSQTLLDMLARKNICSKEFISTQYDHSVQGGAVIGPLQGKGRVQGTSSLTKVVLGSVKAVGLSQGIYPCYSEINAYYMAAAGIDTAIRGLISLGIPLEKIALLDNFCWCSPNEPGRLGQLKQAAIACFEYAIAFGTPFISGKDSMHNDFKGFDAENNPVKVSIPPTLLISSIGVIEDASKAVSIDAKAESDLVYVIGETAEELGGSEYYAYLGFVGNTVPKLDAVKARERYEKISQAIQHELIASCYPVNHGGLGVALAKTAIAGGLGMQLEILSAIRLDYFLFSESQGRFVITIDPKNKAEVEKIFESDALLLGKATKENFSIISASTKLNLPVTKLEEAYKSTLK